MADPAPPSPSPVAPPPPEGPTGLGRVLTGTRPGLERVLLASVPSLVAGTAGAYAVAPWAGGVAAAVAFAAVWWLSRDAAA